MPLLASISSVSSDGDSVDFCEEMTERSFSENELSTLGYVPGVSNENFGRCYVNNVSNVQSDVQSDAQSYVSDLRPQTPDPREMPYVILDSTGNSVTFSDTTDDEGSEDVDWEFFFHFYD